jgi:hypothetical protein
MVCHAVMPLIKIRAFLPVGPNAETLTGSNIWRHIA